MYIEERLQRLSEIMNELKVEMADRLARIETTQDVTNEHLKTMNGSIAKTIERTAILESARALTETEVARLGKEHVVHRSDIASLKRSEIFAKGKMAGIGVGATFLTSILFYLIKLYLLSHHH